MGPSWTFEGYFLEILKNNNININTNKNINNNN